MGGRNRETAHYIARMVAICNTPTGTLGERNPKPQSLSITLFYKSALGETGLDGDYKSHAVTIGVRSEIVSD